MAKDVPGECNARLFLGDDWGDNRCTIRCQLPEDHAGAHQEQTGGASRPPNARNILVQWEGDDRIDETWHEWCDHLWRMEGKPDTWAEPEMPQGWDWEHHAQRLAALK